MDQMSAIPDKAAETVAQQFLEHFIATFGCPLEIHSDQGSNFQSKSFYSLMQNLRDCKDPNNAL